MLQHICMYDSEERATCIVANRLWPMYGPQRWANKNHHPWIDWLIDWYSTTKASIHTLSRENAEWVTNLRERERESKASTPWANKSVGRLTKEIAGGPHLTMWSPWGGARCGLDITGRQGIIGVGAIPSHDRKRRASRRRRRLRRRWQEWSLEGAESSWLLKLGFF